MKVGQARKEFQRILKVVENSGYDGTSNIAEYWIKNEDKINNLAYGIGITGPFECNATKL